MKRAKDSFFDGAKVGIRANEMFRYGFSRNWSARL